MKSKYEARLGDALLEAGSITEQDISKALELQASFGGRLGTNLLEIGALGEGELLTMLGRLRHTQTVEADGFQTIAPDLLRLVPPRLAKRFEVVPVRRSGGTLLVASIDPGDALAEDELSTITGSMVRTVIGLEIRVRAALERYYRIPQSVRLTALSRRLDGRGSGVFSLPGTAVSDSESLADDQSLIAVPDGRSSSATPSAATPAPETASSAEATKLGEQAIARQRPLPPPRTEPIREVAISEEEYADIFGPGNESGSGSGRGGTGSRGSGSGTGIQPNGADTDLDGTAEAAAASLPADPEARLEAAADRLARAGMRDDVADALLAFCRPDLDRRLLLIRRGQQILGWRGEGMGIDAAKARAIEIDSGAPSLFGNLTEHPQLWAGPLPPFPAQASLLAVLGASPSGCVVGPLVVRGKVIGFLYADNGADGIAEAPVTLLERLLRMAGLALEVALLKNKIRTL